jgi:hypothetical protein
MDGYHAGQGLGCFSTAAGARLANDSRLTVYAVVTLSLLSYGSAVRPTDGRIAITPFQGSTPPLSLGTSK